MPQQLLDYINQYGYAIIFLLVFLQEIGVPSFPNEITLYYFGYLASKDNFSLSLVLCISILASIVGALLVYCSFCFFGQTLRKYKPTWLKFSTTKMSALKSKMINSSNNSLLLFRLTPFVRGYVSVIAGIIQLPYKSYVKTIIISSFIWTGVWIVLGFFTSKYFQFILNCFDSSNTMLTILSISIFLILFKFISKVITKKTSSKY